MLHLRRDSDEEIPEIALTVSNRTMFRVIVVIVFTLAVITAVLKVTHALFLIGIAIFLALALNAPVTWIARRIPGKKRGSRPLATTISFLLVVALLTVFASYFVPPLVHQTEKFIHAAPSLVSSAKNQHSALGNFIRRNHLQGFVNSLSKEVSQHFKGGTVFSSLAGIANSIFQMLAVLALTFMMLVEGPRWLGVMRDVFIPAKDTKDLKRIASDMYSVVKGYVNGQVLLAFIASVLITPALLLLHVSYPIALMVVIFLCALIPLVGHPIGAVIITSVALFHSVPSAIIILAYYIFYIQLENYLLQPRIQATATNMSPLLVFASIIIGVNFGGLVGALLAIPIAACIRVLVVEYMTKKRMLPKDLITEKREDEPSKA